MATRDREPVLFVSHHSSKLDTAEHVERALNAKGVKCWIAPRDIEPGEQWDVAIQEAIAATDAMLLLFCSASEKSKQVKRELILADQVGKAIIPLRLERIDPGQLSYHLADSQWIDWLEQRDGVIDRIAAKAHEFQQSDPVRPAPSVVIPVAPGGAGDGTLDPAAPISFDKRSRPAPPPVTPPDTIPHGLATPLPEPATDASAPAGGKKDLKWLWFSLGGLALVGLIALAVWLLQPGSTRRSAKASSEVTEGWFVGTWSDSRNCAIAYRFEANGVLIAPNGARGTWSIEDGDTLVVEGPEGREERTFERVSEDEVRSGNDTSYRCN